MCLFREGSGGVAVALGRQQQGRRRRRNAHWSPSPGHLLRRNERIKWSRLFSKECLLLDCLQDYKWIILPGMLVDIVVLGSLIALWLSPKNYFLLVSKGDLFWVIHIKLHFKKHFQVKTQQCIFPEEKSFLKRLLKASEDKRRFPQSCFWSSGLQQLHILHGKPPRTDQGWTRIYCFLNYKMEKCFYKIQPEKLLILFLSLWTKGPTSCSTVI